MGCAILSAIQTFFKARQQPIGVTKQNRFAEVVNRLVKFYGRPRPPESTKALELILLENVAYLVEDEKRAAASESNGLRTHLRADARGREA